MTYFLERIARLLFDECGNDLRKHCLVFPNRRAGLYFLKYLASEISKPVWSPAIMTINDLFRSLSKLHPAENEILLFELFKVYKSIKKSGENFDDFYFWGDMLLNDFDDVDKYLADVQKLFRNVLDLKKIDEQFGGLTPEQAEIVKRFWINFNPAKSSDEKAKFIGIWEILYDLYNRFREKLKDKNLAYEGMIFRDVIENHDWNDLTGLKWEMIHFIGFNALNACEREIMLILKKEGKARFYWDYDNSYLDKGRLNSAGFFLKDNIRTFGNDMPEDWEYDTILSKPGIEVKRRIIDTSSDISQVKLIPDLIGQLPGLTPENSHHTAVILADEKLLLPLLTSLPGNVKDINITMGFPLKQTSVYLLVKNLLEMQRNARVRDDVVIFSRDDVIRILKDSLITGLLDEQDDLIKKEISEKCSVWIDSGRFVKSEKLSGIFWKPSTPALMSGYLKSVLMMVVSDGAEDGSAQAGSILPVSIRNEFVYRSILSVNRLDSISGDPDVSFNINTWASILDRLLMVQSVPFSGEPLSGIQIMGILETRTLDFKNLIFLSVNEGILPAVSAPSSFIPFSLRDAFGLPSINHQESIYAYHFYRLLHKAENITFIYNSNPDSKGGGEMSRFLQQMKYEQLKKPEFLNLSFEIKNPRTVSTTVERTGEHTLRLNSRFRDNVLVTDKAKQKRLSPSAINTWLTCRMMFYYRYVNDLREPDNKFKEIDPAKLGTLLHEVMKNIWAPYTGTEVDDSVIDNIISDKLTLSQLITNAINEKFERVDDSAIAANEKIVRNVLLKYIYRVMEFDRKAAPFNIIGLERPVVFSMILENDGMQTELKIGGVTDRIDISDGITRIVDYKTGKTADSIKSVNALFENNRKKDADAWLQTLLYCEGYLYEGHGVKLTPSVYKIKRVPGENFTDKLIIKPGKKEEVFVDDYLTIRGEFLNGLQNVVKDIFSNDEPFVMIPGNWECRYCPYRILCMR
ncbi:MAG: PD-(D/E)XK nuclease family protein [Bacteroidales bacterium]|jgi:CRISPR/Cas system-associated exonuclease Cas4 (RecB family)|nr:PD-(D/E)XK nuclease family protein [Bacteroidales bacterium]